jgi:serine/threonine protein kinase
VLKPGDRIGEWVVDSILGEGGMGAVYRVHSALTQRLEAALKVMKPTIAEDARRRFVREAEALSALRHPAIVRVMGFSEDPTRGLLYLVMELAVGETLKDRLARGAMPLPEALRTFVPLASALDHAHEAGIYHRDLKPANVVLCDDGTPRLVDFGIAAGTAGQTMTNTGQMGTLSYLPPEVFRGVVAEPGGIDVYAFGLLLHEALTGTRAYSVDAGLTPAAAAAAVGVRKLQQARFELSPAFPQAVRDAVAAATDPDPAVRPTMRQFRATLQSLVDRRGAPAFTPSPAPKKVPPPVVHAERTMRVPDPPQPDLGERLTEASRGKGGIIAGVLIALLLAVGLVIALTGGGGGGDEARDPGSTGGAASGGSVAGGDGPPATTPAVAPPLPAEESPSPMPSPSAAPPSPSPSPSPIPTPPPPSPPPGPPAAAPTVVRPEVIVAEPPPDEGEEEGPAAVPLGSDVSGQWELSNRVVSTDYEGFRGLNIGYRLTLRQSGSRITGSGVKVTENGTPVATRTPISVSGRIDGSSVVLTFTEQGATRASAGTFRWQLSSDGSSLRGSFWSDAANTNGPSSGRRVD